MGGHHLSVTKTTKNVTPFQPSHSQHTQTTPSSLISPTIYLEYLRYQYGHLVLLSSLDRDAEPAILLLVHHYSPLVIGHRVWHVIGRRAVVVVHHVVGDIIEGHAEVISLQAHGGIVPLVLDTYLGAGQG